MKELTREVTTTEVIGYRAADGKEFRNKEECETYERTAKGVIQADFEKLVMAENNEYGLFESFGGGGEDYRIVRIIIHNMEELRQANMHSQLIKNKNLFTEEHIGKNLIVGTGCEHDACYLYGTIEELVEKFRADITEALFC